MEELNRLSERIIGGAIEVHRELGPGLLEATYEAALCIEFDLTGLNYRRQLPIAALYKGHEIGEYLPDLIVEDRVVIEVKSVERFDPVFEAQVLTYLRITGKRLGLLVNFNRRLVVDGIKRYML